MQDSAELQRNVLWSTHTEMHPKAFKTHPGIQAHAAVSGCRYALQLAADAANCCPHINAPLYIGTTLMCQGAIVWCNHGVRQVGFCLQT